MTLTRIADWLDRTLDVRSFSDVSNNGVQIARRGTQVTQCSNPSFLVSLDADRLQENVGDVVAGALIGTVCGIAAVCIVNAVYKKFVDPKLFLPEGKAENRRQL